MRGCKGEGRSCISLEEVPLEPETPTSGSCHEDPKSLEIAGFESKGAPRRDPPHLPGSKLGHLWAQKGRLQQMLRNNLTWPRKK